MPELKNLEVLEVSLVDRPANRRRFLLTKSERDSAVEELIALCLESDLENESEIDEVLKDAPEQTREALKGALKLVNAHREDVSTEILKSLLVKSGFVEESVEGSNDDDGNDDTDAILKDDGTVDLEKVPEHLRPMIESLWKDRNTATEEAETLKVEIAKREEEAEMKMYLSKAEGFKLPTENERFAGILRNIGKAMPDDVEFLDALFTKMSALIEASEVLKEAGTTGSDDVRSAYERAEQMAEEMVKELDGKITKEAAVDAVFKANPDLANEYVKEGK